MPSILALPRPLDGLRSFCEQAIGHALWLSREHPRALALRQFGERLGGHALRLSRDHSLTPSLKRFGEQIRGHALRLSHDHPRGLIVSVSIAGFGAALGVAQLGAGAAGHAAVPLVPPPLLLQRVAPAEAVMINAAIPMAGTPTVAAAPFAFAGNAISRAQALECLTSAVYYESGSESADGKRAVAQVVLNRVRHPAFPASVCGVVYQGSTRATGCQFTFTCDGSLHREPDRDGWAQAKAIAEAALLGAVYSPIGWSTHYHANYVVPYWAASMTKESIVGAHLFYGWRGAWGDPAIFRPRYSGHEASAADLRTAALAAEDANLALVSGLGSVHVSGGDTDAIAEIPGAEVKLTPSMRGDKRVAVRFNQAARTATAALEHEDYVHNFAASDNLKWSLRGGSARGSSSEAPLGKIANSGAAPSEPSGESSGETPN